VPARSSGSCEDGAGACSFSAISETLPGHLAWDRASPPRKWIAVSGLLTQRNFGNDWYRLATWQCRHHTGSQNR
jgi:hypothetical protein